MEPSHSFTSLTFLLLVLFLFLFSPSLAFPTAPNTTSPNTLPSSFLNPNFPGVVATDLSTLPSQIFVTDGDLRYFPVIVNCVGTLLGWGVKEEEIYVMTYGEDITELLEKVGVKTIWRPDWVEEARKLIQKHRCKQTHRGKEQMDFVMYMKRRLYLELALRDVKWMIFDSDVAFRANPQQIMDANKEPSMYGENIDMIVYGSPSVAIGAIGGWSNDQRSRGKLGVNGSPGAFLNPKLLVPWMKALYVYGVAVWEECKWWGWVQVSDNSVLFQMGIKWEVIAGEKPLAFRGAWGEPKEGMAGVPQQRGSKPLKSVLDEGLWKELLAVEEEAGGEEERNPAEWVAEVEVVGGEEEDEAAKVEREREGEREKEREEREKEREREKREREREREEREREREEREKLKERGKDGEEELEREREREREEREREREEREREREEREREREEEREIKQKEFEEEENEEKLSQQKQPKRMPNIIATDTGGRFMPAHHYHGPGGPPSKEAMMRKGKEWFVKQNWQQILNGEEGKEGERGEGEEGKGKEKKVGIWDLLIFTQEEVLAQGGKGMRGATREKARG